MRAVSTLQLQNRFVHFGLCLSLRPVLEEDKVNTVNLRDFTYLFACGLLSDFVIYRCMAQAYLVVRATVDKQQNFAIVNRSHIDCSGQTEQPLRYPKYKRNCFHWSYSLTFPSDKYSPSAMVYITHVTRALVCFYLIWFMIHSRVFICS